ncbi:MAG: permease-like cell division protein FtsX [bacterium]|nr:permease-like cell division protein FtsX [bacterium]
MSLKYSLRHIRRSPYQTLSAILIMVITFFMVSVFLLLAFVSSGILRHFETQPQISAFYPNETPETEILDVKKELEQTNLTKNVRYISSKEAVEIYKKDTAIDNIDPNLDLISDKILPPSLEITTWSLNDLRVLKTMVEKKEGVKVVFIEEIVDKLSSWLSGLRTGGLILLILLAVESILVVWTIIGMRISQRKHEIEIMRLLGATSWYIRAPFILEGILYGIIGSMIGVLITAGLLQVVLPGVAAFLNGIPIIPLSAENAIKVVSNATQMEGVPLSPVSPFFILLLIAVEAVIGALIGAIGSYSAVVRNLKRY